MYKTNIRTQMSYNGLKSNFKILIKFKAFGGTLAAQRGRFFELFMQKPFSEES